MSSTAPPPPDPTPPTSADGSAPASTQTPADSKLGPAAEDSASTDAGGLTALTDPTNIHMVVVCPRCGATQPSNLRTFCASCGKGLRGGR